MTYYRILIGITTALLSMIVLGCAGPTTEKSVGFADATASPSVPTSLCGTWQGSFWYVAGDHTSSSGSLALTLQVAGDSTYTLKRGNRPASSGTVASEGNRVILQEASGAHVTLVRSGDKLYGLTKDDLNGRTTMLNLEKEEPAPNQFAAAAPRC